MTNDPTVKTSVDARGVARLTLARGLKHNALSAQMLTELTDAARLMGQDEAVRVVVLAADGASFCAGGDLGWMRAQMDGSACDRRAAAVALARMLGALNTLPKPLIGRVHGNAYGGGIGLMAVCDVVFAAETVKFGLTETRLGLIPATIGPYVIARMGEAAARRVFMSGRVFDATEAKELGLVAVVAAPEQLDTLIQREIEAYLLCAPAAVAEAKRLVRSLGPTIDEAKIAASVDALIGVWEGREAAEGIAAFFEKRKPRWQL